MSGDDILERRGVGVWGEVLGCRRDGDDGRSVQDSDQDVKGVQNPGKDV